MSSSNGTLQRPVLFFPGGHRYVCEDYGLTATIEQFARGMRFYDLEMSRKLQNVFGAKKTATSANASASVSATAYADSLLRFVVERCDWAVKLRPVNPFFKDDEEAVYYAEGGTQEDVVRQCVIENPGCKIVALPYSGDYRVDPSKVDYKLAILNGNRRYHPDGTEFNYDGTDQDDTFFHG